MSRACCCSVSHTDVISPITTIQQYGDDAISMAIDMNHFDIVSMIVQVVGECDCERWCVCDCVCVCVCVCDCVWYVSYAIVCGM